MAGASLLRLLPGKPLTDPHFEEPHMEESKGDQLSKTDGAYGLPISAPAWLA